MNAIGLLLLAGRVHGGEALRMRVTPAMSRAPAFVTVRVSLASTADDRLLRIVAESADFYRSSEIPLDGDKAPRTTRFEFRSLPGGLYTVRAVLKGVNEEALASTHQEINIVASAYAR